MNTSSLLVLPAAALIAGLALYALHLWRQVWSLQRKQRKQDQQHRAQLGADLRILAGSLLEGQLPLIEGAIRIKVLLDNYDHALSQDGRCEVFHLLYDATAQVPTHAGWQALDRAERRRHETHFNELELQHKAAARSAARWLLDEGLPGSSSNT
ncbi:DUF2489 domain-containing protein [Pseudomonas borbori]